MKEGKVKFFNESKGYGFIKDVESDEEYFVHVSGLIDKIKEDDDVTFELTEGRKGLNAVNVKLIQLTTSFRINLNPLLQRGVFFTLPVNEGAEYMSKIDLVVQTYTMSEISKEQEKGLLDALCLWSGKKGMAKEGYSILPLDM